MKRRAFCVTALMFVVLPCCLFGKPPDKKKSNWLPGYKYRVCLPFHVPQQFMHAIREQRGTFSARRNETLLPAAVGCPRGPVMFTRADGITALRVLKWARGFKLVIIPVPIYNTPKCVRFFMYHNDEKANRCTDNMQQIMEKIDDPNGLAGSSPGNKRSD